MKTELLPISSITVNERLRYEDDDIDDLCDSITRFGGEPTGLLQPILVDHNNILQDGFRRFTACTRLGWTSIPVHRRTALTDAEYFEIELETNFRRKQFTWREIIHAVCKIHRLRKREASAAGTDWHMEHTGELLGGYSKSYVSNCMMLDKVVDLPTFDECDGITDAVKLLYRQKEDAAVAELAARTKLIQPAAPPALDILLADDDEPVEQPTSDAPQTVSLSNMLYAGDSIRTILPSWPAGCVDHIIADPPYGIDVDMMNQATGAVKDIDRITSTHQVAENEDLIDHMFPQLYRVLKPTGFCILFADMMQWQRLYDNAIKAGFKVQRWPFTWCKTSQCKNQYVQANFTKNTEIAIVCRRENATLGRPVQTSYFTCGRAETLSNPFAKPFELWEFLINAVSLQGQTILDPFAGEGSSTLAALRTFRRPLAIERDSTHFPYLIENVKQHYLSTFKNVTFT